MHVYIPNISITGIWVSSSKLADADSIRSSDVSLHTKVQFLELRIVYIFRLRTMILNVAWKMFFKQTVCRILFAFDVLSAL